MSYAHISVRDSQANTFTTRAYLNCDEDAFLFMKDQCLYTAPYLKTDNDDVLAINPRKLLTSQNMSNLMNVSVEADQHAKEEEAKPSYSFENDLSEDMFFKALNVLKERQIASSPKATGIFIGIVADQIIEKELIVDPNVKKQLRKQISNQVAKWFQAHIS